MKRAMAVLLTALMCLAAFAGPAAAAAGQGKPNSPGRGNPYPPGQSGKCPPSQEAEHGGCPPASKGKGKGVQATSTSAMAGEEFSASGSGYRPNSQVKAVMGDKAVPGGVFKTDSAGNFEAKMSIPSDAKAGSHPIKFTGIGADGQALNTTLPMVVTGPALLTGASPDWQVPAGLSALAALALVAITALFVRSRRVSAEGV